MLSILVKARVLVVDLEGNLAALDYVVERLTQLHDVVLDQLQRS